MKSSEYIEQQRRGYSIYVMESRAIPAVTDGLKAAARRVLWTGRDGKKYKSAVLAGATMPIHPHSSPEDAINTLAAPYGNNIPLLEGDGAFGTLISPKAYGASRYTSVKTSLFTKDVVFADIDIIPMRENYDGTLMEPVHFLPLIPISLLNPSDGIAIGFATTILPRSLESIIVSQLAVLKGATKVSDPTPSFAPTNQTGTLGEDGFFYFTGTYEQHNATTVTITGLPYGVTHDHVTNALDKGMESGDIIDYTDDTRDFINIKVKFKRGVLSNNNEKTLLKMLGLTSRVRENLNILSFEGNSIWSANASDVIVQFTNWRLKWYVQRYERLKGLLELDLQRYYDIRLAIKHKAGDQATKHKDRSALKEWLQSIGVVHTDYIADLPVYRFTQDEHAKNEQRITEGETLLKEYNSILSSEQKRKDIYAAELQAVLKKFYKGEYTAPVLRK